MKNLRRKLSALAVTALFASIQVSYALVDTGLGNGNGGAVINNVTGGFVNGVAGNNSYDLNFNGNAHVNWDSLNVNKGESLNFNAVNGANNLTVLNTVNSGMSTIYGQINSNSGIGKLIISNPNGVLFDGAKFTTAGDLLLTTKDLSNVRVEDLGNLNLDNAKFNKIYNDNGEIIGITIKNSDFQIGGDYNIAAPVINAVSSTIGAKSLKLVTSNGHDYLALGGTPKDNKQIAGVRLEAVNRNKKKEFHINRDKFRFKYNVNMYSYEFESNKVKKVVFPTNIIYPINYKEKLAELNENTMYCCIK